MPLDHTCIPNVLIDFVRKYNSYSPKRELFIDDKKVDLSSDSHIRRLGLL